MSLMWELYYMIPSWRFNVSTCKTLLKKIIKDAEKLIETKNKDNEAIREEISKLLRTPGEHEAHILIATYVDQKNLILVLQNVIYFAGLVASHLLFIASQKELHPEMKEAVASLCYVESRYSELPALHKLKSQFSVKYGKEFVANARMCKEDCGVNKQIPELLVVPNPPVEERNNLLKEIANQFKINWEPDSVFYLQGYSLPVKHKLRLQDNMEIVPSRMQSET